MLRCIGKTLSWQPSLPPVWYFDVLFVNFLQHVQVENLLKDMRRGNILPGKLSGLLFARKEPIHCIHLILHTNFMQLCTLGLLFNYLQENKHRRNSKNRVVGIHFVSL